MAVDPALFEQRLAGLVEALAPFDRSVLLLGAQEGLTVLAIARRLGVSRRRVERALARALAAIDRGLEDCPRP